jgi:hypothetical protein
MATEFQINGATPSDEAYPTGSGYQYLKPMATGKSGQGDPVGAAGKPGIVLKFKKLTHAAWDYYAGLVGSTALYVELSSLNTWNPYKSGGGDWVLYDTAKLHMPTFANMDYGCYTGVEVRITELVE